MITIDEAEAQAVPRPLLFLVRDGPIPMLATRTHELAGAVEVIGICTAIRTKLEIFGGLSSPFFEILPVDLGDLPDYPEIEHGS